MGAEQQQWVTRLEKGAANGSIDVELQALFEASAKAGQANASAKFIQDVMQEADKKGLLPTLAKSYAIANFSALDLDSDGYIGASELDRITGSRLLCAATNPLEKGLLRYMRKHVNEIAKLSNDQWGWETKISPADLKQFAQRSKMRAFSNEHLLAADFSNEQKTIKDPSKQFLPNLILDFGKEHFTTLDFNNDGFISRLEIRKLLESQKWAKALGPSVTHALRQADIKYEQIERSHRDELWYKDTKGITRKDLEKYAEHQRANSRDIPQTPGDHRLSITVGGIKREFSVHIPPGYDGKKALPVMYFFHYFTGDDQQLARYTQMNKKADQENFIVVYPKAEGWLPNRWRQWNLNNNPNYRVDEIAFVEQLMNKIDTKLSTDKSRNYVVGYSNGGMIAHEVACKFPERVAALVSVAGCQNGSERGPGIAIPVMMINGTEDWLVPFNGRRFTPLFPIMKPLSYARNFWTKNNQSDDRRVAELFPGVNKETFTSKRSGAEVVILTMKGSGHGWPGSDESIDGNVCRSFKGTDVVWDFLSSKRKSR
jgi:polyhydroxybutyrate depolymerase